MPAKFTMPDQHQWAYNSLAFEKIYCFLLFRKALDTWPMTLWRAT